MAASTYGEQLGAAMKRLPISQRRLSFLLAEQTGNNQESERRSIGKYLKNEGAPEPDRAAILAVLLRAPELALVPDAVTRRRGRLAELEARIAVLEGVSQASLHLLDDVIEQVESLSKRSSPKRGTAVRKA